MAKKRPLQPTLFDCDPEVPEPKSVEQIAWKRRSPRPSRPSSVRPPIPPPKLHGSPFPIPLNRLRIPIPPLPLQAGDRVVVVDSHSLIYQVFHAMPAMTGPHGNAVGAIHGFLRDLADLRDQYQPAFLLCAFDLSDETFRNEIYPAYKQHRDPMPDDLRGQLPYIHRALEALDIPILAVPGFEADDILATIAHLSKKYSASACW